MKIKLLLTLVLIFGGYVSSFAFNIKENRAPFADSTKFNKVRADELAVYPNPASEKIVIKYYIAKNANVIITVIDIVGNKALEVLSNEQTAGSYSETLELNGRLPKGLYFVRLQAGNNVTMKRISVQ